MEISLDFTGNEGDLVSSFDRVGQASKSMSDQVDDSGSKMRESGAAFDTMSEGADTAETRFTGFYDTLGGTRDALAALGDDSLSTSDKLIALGQAGADLAGGLAGFVIPMMQSLWSRIMATAAAQSVLTAAQTVWNAITTASTVAMGALNAVMRANPIMTVITIIGLLVAAFLLLWNKSEGFRNFFIGMWNAIKTAVGAVIDWIKGAWNGMIGFFTGLVRGIGDIFGGIGNLIKNAFKGAINFIIDALNLAIGAINFLIRGYNAIPIAPDIPEIPKIKRLHSGGTVPGMPGEEVLAILQAGEHVGMSGQGNGGGSTLVVAPGADKGVADLINFLVRKKYIRLV